MDLGLDKLKEQLGIESFDAAQINKLLIDNQKTIKLILFLLSGLIVVLMFNAHTAKSKSLDTKISQAKQKLEVIQARNAAIQDLNNFKSSLSKEITVFDLIRMISNDAKSNNSQIVSYTPSQGKDMGLYGVVNVNFVVSSNSFKDMMLFLRKIEKSNMPIMVNAWSGHQEDSGKISFTLEISVVNIHP